jgi:hypothetical protein
MTKLPAVVRFAVVRLELPHDPEVSCEVELELSTNAQDAQLIFTPDGLFAVSVPFIIFKKDWALV